MRSALDARNLEGFDTSRKDNVFSLDVPLDAATNVAEVAEFKEREMKRQKTTDGKEEDPEPVAHRAVRGVPGAAGRRRRRLRISSARRSAGRAPRPSEPRAHHAQRARRAGAALLRRRRLDAKKLDVLAPMPEEINLEHLRGAGMRDDEVALPDEAEKANAADAADSRARRRRRGRTGPDHRRAGDVYGFQRERGKRRLWR